MAAAVKGVDEAFRGAGTKPGLDIWCVANQRLVSISKPSHGKFFSGSSYIVLNTVLLKSGLSQHEIHYWVGKDSKEVDSAMASDKAVELDAALGSCAVQYREAQGCETEKFLSYFKPCILPMEGVFTSEVGGLGSKNYRARLLTCKGEHAVYVREVPFSRSSLNHNDVFVLDTESKIFLFCGSDSSIQERAKALEVVQYVKDNWHGGMCEVATIEGGKFVGDPDVGKFWSLFGGYAPITRDSTRTNHMQPNKSNAKILWINTGKLHPIEAASLERGMLSTDKCYMLDHGTEIFVWMGRNTLVSERKTSISAIEEIIHSQGRSMGTHITFLTEGSETTQFKSHFEDWPQTVVPNLYEEGRGKVAAIFKHQGYDVKELPEEGCQPCIDCSGVLKVWQVECNGILLVPTAEQSKLFSGDCYIVQYIYPGNERDEYLFYAWLGCCSTAEDRVDAVCLMSKMADSIKGHPVVAQIFEGREPTHFFAIFQTLIIFKGGMSSGYKRFISERGSTDETYDKDKTALFRVQGSGPDNMQAIQVDLVSSSLNTSGCYILQDGTFIFSWAGNLSSASNCDLVDRMLDLINGKEIFNFTQDDLTTEDVLILDCYDEIYVWIGQHAKFISKQEALTVGKKFLEADILLENLSLEAAIYVIIEGSEPPFFTRFFNWDSSKAYMHGNSFERKLAILKGLAPNMETPRRGSLVSSRRYPSEHTTDHPRSKSISSDGPNMRSGSPASSVSSGYEVLKTHHLTPSPVTRELFTDGSSESLLVMGDPDCSIREVKAVSLEDYEGTEVDYGLRIFSYERLKVPSDITATDIDVAKREAYLCNEEFQLKFGMTKNAFYKLPKWRQNKLKMALNLF